MEYLDVVDKKDKVIRKASKKEVYEKKLIHRIVHILIFDKKGRMALQLRSKVFFCPYCWSTAVGGHVKSGESCEKAALREFKEELGVKRKLEFFSKDFYQAKDIPNKFLYTYKAVYEGPFKVNKKAVEKIEFFTMKEIAKMIKNKEKFHPELLFLLKKYFL